MLKQRLIKRLEKAKEQVEAYVTQNHAHDIAQYKYATGQINGLEAAINICRDVFKGEDNDEL